MAEDTTAQPDVGVRFVVRYSANLGRAKLQVREQTRGATEYGVNYQVGIQYSDNRRWLSEPVPLEDARMTEIEADLLGGEKLLVRMVDNQHDHLAASAVDRDNWPANFAADSIRDTEYWLYVPQERLKKRDW